MSHPAEATGDAGGNGLGGGDGVGVGLGGGVGVTAAVWLGVATATAFGGAGAVLHAVTASPAARANPVRSLTTRHHPLSKAHPYCTPADARELPIRYSMTSPDDHEVLAEEGDAKHEQQVAAFTDRGGVVAEPRMDSTHKTTVSGP